MPDQLIDPMPPIHDAAMKNNCDYEVNPDDVNIIFQGNTPLLWAVASTSVNFALKLMEIVDREQLNSKSGTIVYQNTPLILSLAKGWTHQNSTPETKTFDPSFQNVIAKRLIEKGANVNLQDASGYTALHYACMHRNIEAIKFLVEAGAKWNIPDNQGKTPLGYCCMDYNFIKATLQDMTGGLIKHTFTLSDLNFKDDCQEFYRDLSVLLDKDESFEKTLSALYEYNKKLHDKLGDIYKHINSNFPNLERYITEKTSSIENLLVTLSDNKKNKFRAWIKLYFDLKTKASSCFDFNTNEYTYEAAKQQIDELIQEALKNPALNSEHVFIKKLGYKLLNLLSLICLGLPLLVNHHKTGRFFFAYHSDQKLLINSTKTELESILKQFIKN